MKEQKWIYEGLIIESLHNSMFRIRLNNENIILGYVSGRIRRGFIRILLLPGDKIQIEISRYDLTKGRIIMQQGFKRLDPFFQFPHSRHNSGLN